LLGRKDLELALRMLRSIDVLADLSGKSLVADTDLLAEDLSIDFTGWVRLQILLTADAIVSVKLNGKLGALNEGTPLRAGNLYAFDITVHTGDAFNVQIDTSQTPDLFRLVKLVV